MTKKRKLSKSSQEWFERMKGIADDGSEPINNEDVRAIHEHENPRYYSPSE